MSAALTLVPTEPLAVRREVIRGELPPGATRRRCRLEPLADAAGAAVAALVVTAEAPAMASQAFALTFTVFVLTGATVRRRPHRSALLPFTHAVVSLLYRAGAAGLLWILMEVAGVVHAPVAVLAFAAIAAAATTAAVALRVPAPPATRLALIGNATSAEQLRGELIAFGVSDQEIVGIVTAQPAHDVLLAESVPVLGTMADLAAVLERHDVDILLIDRAASRIGAFEQLVDTCVGMPVRVCELSQFYEEVLGHVAVREISSAWFRYIMHPRFRSPDTVVKRTLDLTVALVAGLAFLPVIGACALLIKLHDGGPVLFRQRRIGSRGREFTLLKLRTMRTAPAVARWSSAHDQRVTPIGRLLRRTHLDEMPQLLNVLRGEMSVVGPRPEQPEFVARLEQALPHYSRRHLIKPGLTGWAQVRCGYASSDAESGWKLCHDLYYLKHQSIWFDLAILVETVRTLVADRQFRNTEPADRPVAVATDEQPALGSAAHAMEDPRPAAPSRDENRLSCVRTRRAIEVRLAPAHSARVNAGSTRSRRSAAACRTPRSAREGTARSPRGRAT
jgi:exopolysaccharide biosynthesis polyprenyl glycosylphosphotransferase